MLIRLRLVVIPVLIATLVAAAVPVALILLIVLPLAVPVLVFGASAVQATQAGQSPLAPLGLIAAQLLVMAWISPVLIAKALRLACE